MREKFLQNLRLHLIDLSRRLEQDPSDDVFTTPKITEVNKIK